MGTCNTWTLDVGRFLGKIWTILDENMDDFSKVWTISGENMDELRKTWTTTVKVVKYGPCFWTVDVKHGLQHWTSMFYDEKS